MSRNTKFQYDNSSEEFHIGQCVIKVKVTAEIQGENFSTKGQFTHRRHDTTRQHATRPVFSLPIQLSLVHTYATRYDTTACDTTGQRTKARRFFSLVPHMPRHDHATRLIYYKLYGNFVMCS